MVIMIGRKRRLQAWRIASAGPLALVALGMDREVDHHDRVLLHQADQEEHPDQRDHAELGAERTEREERAHARRRERREDRDRQDEALVEDAEHEVHRDDGREDQPRLARERRLEAARGALEPAVDRGGHADSRHRVVDDLGRGRQRDALGQAERDGRGGELPLMIHRERRVGEFVARDRGERHLVPRRRADVHVLERFRARGVPRIDLHDDAILIALGVDRRDDGLAERVAEGRVDQIGRDAEPRGGRPVDHHGRLQAARLLVGAHVGELRHGLERRLQSHRPGAQQLEVVALQRVLVRPRPRAPADPDVLHRHEEEARGRHRREARAQPGDHLARGGAALGERLQRDEHRARIARSAAGDRRHLVHGGIRADDLDQSRHLVPRRRKRARLVGADPADQSAGVLLREEALRDR